MNDLRILVAIFHCFQNVSEILSNSSLCKVWLLVDLVKQSAIRDIFVDQIELLVLRIIDNLI